jgi:hypothetical protein
MVQTIIKVIMDLGGIAVVKPAEGFGIPGLRCRYKTVFVWNHG